jgi:aspartyl-tRNA(Asn)/glutamyl-tRNA(Gln) amidotransferase subunit B
MQEGSFRCDANVSVRRVGDAKLGTRTETKNLNSFRFVEQAIEFEIARQIEVLEGGGTVVQETRLFDCERGETRPLRVKEEANDYRYFPEPDLLPLSIAAAEVEAIRATLPELPDAKRARFVSAYGLPKADAGILAADRDTAEFYETVVRAAGGEAKTCANWVIGELSAALNRAGQEIARSPVPAAMLGGLVRRIKDGTISGKIAKDVFEAMWNGEGDADRIIEVRGLRQVTDAGLIERLVDEVLTAHAEQAEKFRQGKEKVLAFLVGQVMQKSQGKANPQQVNELIRRKLSP